MHQSQNMKRVQYIPPAGTVGNVSYHNINSSHLCARLNQINGPRMCLGRAITVCTDSYIYTSCSLNCKYTNICVPCQSTRSQITTYSEWKWRRNGGCFGLLCEIMLPNGPWWDYVSLKSSLWWTGDLSRVAPPHCQSGQPSAPRWTRTGRMDC